jgi:hypothetical protein
MELDLVLNQTNSKFFFVKMIKIESTKNSKNQPQDKTVNFIFSQKFISIFGGLFSDKIDLRVR